MNESSCMIAFPTATLVGYWLGELDGLAEAQFEEHLFACVHCSERLRSIVQLGQEVRNATRVGNLHAVITTPSVRRQRHVHGDATGRSGRGASLRTAA
jgi:anti-sigma factor RsiW